MQFAIWRRAGAAQFNSDLVPIAVWHVDNARLSAQVKGAEDVLLAIRPHEGKNVTGDRYIRLRPLQDRFVGMAEGDGLTVMIKDLLSLVIFMRKVM